MAKINPIRRLAIIINKLRNSEYIPPQKLIDEVNQTMRWRYSEANGCTQRTLQRDFNTIEELFGLTISHNKNKGYLSYKTTSTPIFTKNYYGTSKC